MAQEKVTVKTRERYHCDSWHKMQRIFIFAIWQAGTNQKKSGGSFSQHLADILNNESELIKLLKKNPRLAFTVTATLECGRLTINEFIRELTK